ncbi:MAG: O-antigen ligase family protein [Patescibacteria group bacterium]
MSLEILFFFLLLPLMVFAWFNWPKAVALVPLFLPAYLFKIQIYSYPINWLEAVVLIVFITAWLKGYGLALFNFLWQPKVRSWLVIIVLWLLTGLVSLFIGENLKLAAGILKGWLVLPFIWLWLMGYVINSNESRSVYFWRLSVKALLLNGLITALAAVFYWLVDGSRAGGWYDSPNVLAMYLLPIFWLAVWQLFEDKEFYQDSKLLEGLLKGMAVLMLLVIILTGSYTALLSLVVTFVAWLIFKKYPTYKLKVFLVVLLCLFGLSLPLFVVINKNWPWLSHTNTTYNITSGQIRQIFWQEAYSVIIKQPLTGIGLGGWQSLFRNKLQPNLPENKLPGYSIEFYYASLFPHNLYLTVWLFQGFLGLIILLGLFWKITKPGWLLPVIMLLPWLVYGVVDTPLYKNDYAFLFVFMILAVWFKEIEKLKIDQI